MTYVASRRFRNLDDDLYALIKREATNQDRTIGAVLNDAMRMYLEAPRHGSQPKTASIGGDMVITLPSKLNARIATLANQRHQPYDQFLLWLIEFEARRIERLMKRWGTQALVEPKANGGIRKLRK